MRHQAFQGSELSGRSDRDGVQVSVDRLCVVRYARGAELSERRSRASRPLRLSSALVLAEWLERVPSFSGRPRLLRSPSRSHAFLKAVQWVEGTRWCAWGRSRSMQRDGTAGSERGGSVSRGAWEVLRRCAGRTRLAVAAGPTRRFSRQGPLDASCGIRLSKAQCSAGGAIAAECRSARTNSASSGTLGERSFQSGGAARRGPCG